VRGPHRDHEDRGAREQRTCPRPWIPLSLSKTLFDTLGASAGWRFEPDGHAGADSLGLRAGVEGACKCGRNGRHSVGLAGGSNKQRGGDPGDESADRRRWLVTSTRVGAINKASLNSMCPAGSNPGGASSS
jgi:hypothetical protein